MSSAISLLCVFEDFEIRWNGNPDKPEWIAQDLAAALGIKGYRQVVSRYPDNYKGVTLSDGLDGRKREMLTVTEPGFYRMVFASRKPEADVLRALVFEEVLPSIRKYGCYPHWADGEALSPQEEEEYQAALVELYEFWTSKLGEPFEDEHISIIGEVGYLSFKERDISPTAIAESLDMDVAEVERRMMQLQRWGMIGDCSLPAALDWKAINPANDPHSQN